MPTGMIAKCELSQEDKEKNIHQLRKDISKLTDQATVLRNHMGCYGKAGRELSIIITKLEEAKMWGGKVLGAIGKELPADYPADNAAPTVDGAGQEA